MGFRPRFADNDPFSTESLGRMTEMRDDGIAAFVGPDLNCKSAALVATAWNLPMIGYVRNRA